MNSPYSYVRKTDNLGVGVGNVAFALPYPTPIINTYGPRYNVHKSFAPLTGAVQYPLVQSVPDVGLRANGVYMSGVMMLNPLSGSDKK